MYLILLHSSTLVQNRKFTAEARSAQRNDFLFGGERPPNKKPSFMSEQVLFEPPWPGNATLNLSPKGESL
jgi:hypothetical protein